MHNSDTWVCVFYSTCIIFVLYLKENISSTSQILFCAFPNVLTCIYMHIYNYIYETFVNVLDLVEAIYHQNR